MNVILKFLHPLLIIREEISDFLKFNVSELEFNLNLNVFDFRATGFMSTPFEYLFTFKDAAFLEFCFAFVQHFLQFFFYYYTYWRIRYSCMICPYFFTIAAKLSVVSVIL